MIVGYCRVGSLEPTAALEAQKRELASKGAEALFSERIGLFSAAQELDRAIEFAGKGDVIAITKPYRVARTTRGVVKLIERLNRKGVGLRIVNTPIDTSTTTGRMILGSTPTWSLGISPWQSALWDVCAHWWPIRSRCRF